MNDITFSNSFNFRVIKFESYHHTDNSHGTDSHFFAYMISGRCKIVTESETVEIGAGDIFYIPLNCRYHSYWYGEPEVKFFSLGFLYLPKFENISYFCQTLPTNDETIELFYRIAKDDRTSAESIALFYTLASKLLPHMKHYKLSRTEEIVIKTSRYLAKEPNASTAELAANAAVSVSYLYYAFGKSCEVTLGELRSRILLEHAKDILITTDMPIERLSDELGFSSASYFRKRFKQHFSMSPREMRRRYRI